MRILEVLDTYYPKFDGPTLVITSYCKSINKIDGYSAEVCVPYFPDYKDNQPFFVNRVKSLKGPEGYYYGIPKIDKKLKNYLKQNKFDVIHIHSPFTMCNFFAKYGKKHNIPTIFTFHTKFKEDFERTFKTKLMQNLAMKYILHNINMVDKVLTVSDGAKQCLQEYGYKKNIDVLRNGTDLTFPSNSEELIEKVNALHNFNKNDIIFLSVGRIVKTKKLDFALDVMKNLKNNNVDFKYVIVGAGPDEEELHKKVENEDLSQNVIFTGKIMDRELLSAYYLRSNLFIFPSTFDTASLAPIEAAAMKLPTIMTKGCSTAEIITDKQNGLLAEETVEDWSNTIINAINNNLLSLLKENAYKEVYKTWDDVAKEVIEYYNNTVKNN